jgi:hypothetical protein
MKAITIVLIIFYLISSSCNKNSEEKFESYYEIIDGFVRMEIIDTDRIIELDLIKVVQDTFDYDKLISDNNGLLPPPLSPPRPIGVVSISKSLLKSFYSNELIDKVDIEYMFNQIANFKDSLLNPNRINGKIIRASTIDSIRKYSTANNFFDMLEKIYKARSLIKFSIPIISSDRKTMIFDMEEYCGRECGWGRRYIVKKENNKWRIKYQKRTWIS